MVICLVIVFFFFGLVIIAVVIMLHLLLSRKHYISYTVVGKKRKWPYLAESTQGLFKKMWKTPKQCPNTRFFALV